jgi:DNA-binding SARP family transcriptional activator/tetratricopeptide (TPR) repeat protein
MQTFQLLGPVGVVVDGRQIDLGSPKQRIVLASLLVDAGRPVGVDVLIDRVWDEAPSGAARRMVSTYVSRLRRVLGPVHADSGETVQLVRRSGGYELGVDLELVDLHRFRRMVAAAEDRSRPDGERAGQLRDALGLWQGTALSDLPCGWAERMRQAWHQQRVDAAVAWARLELSLGNPRPVIGTVRDLVVEHPLVEPLAGVLIQALDLDGRTAEALDCFAATRRRLIDELGVEPGVDLRVVHESVLRGQDHGPGDSRPTPAVLTTEPGRAPGRAERQLPADVADFVGRTNEIARLREVLLAAAPGPRLAAVSGPPGVGKTALAVRTGHDLASRFPDGQLYVALRGTSDEPADPAEVLAQLLRVLGVDGSALPAEADARGALFRSRLAGRRMLLILDDASGHHQVGPLLPGDGAAVVVTSRAPLTGLPGVTTIDIRPLPEPAAIELLSRVAGEARVRAEPTAAVDLVVTCGGLPLAVRIAAARLAAHRHWSVESLAKRLTDERRRLDELRHGDLAVRPGLQVAYRGLTPSAGRAFALLGKLDVPSFTDWPVAALLDTGPTAGAAALEELVDARLVDELGPDVAGQMRYRFHEVTKAFARERQATDVDEADWAAALARVGASWLILARHAQDGLLCERHYLDDRADHGSPAAVDEHAIGVAAGRPLEWFEAERDALTTLIPACAEAGRATLARGLAGCVTDFYDLRGYYADWRRTTDAALAACRRAGDRAGEAAMLRGLGSCLLEFDDVGAALTTLHAARALAEEIGEPAGAAMAGKHIGLVLGLTGRLDEAERELRAGADELRRTGVHPAESRTLTHLGFVLRQRGDTAEAVRAIRAALTIAQACGDLFAQACATRGLAGAQLEDGQTRDAKRAARRAVALFERIGDPIGAAQSLRVLGEALACEPHGPDEAEHALASAAAIFRDRGHAWGCALVELNLGEIEVRRGAAGAAERLRHTLRFWTEEKIPLLQARTLVALAAAAEHDGDPSAGELLRTAHRIYEDLRAPQAADLAERLGIRSDTTTART